MSPGNAIRITNVCTVFVESEIIAHLARGEKVEDILRGVHLAIGSRTAGVAGRGGAEPGGALTGGGGRGGGMITAGVDIGAGTTKAVLMDDAGRILVKVSERSGARLDAAGSRALAAVLEKAGLRREDIAYVAATGYGRYQLPERDIQITEVTCHARG